jgi:predicted RNA binding protein YcfA (HicA-like mRNA interferase family)
MKSNGESKWISEKEIIKLIEADGWCAVRQKGSHRQYKHPVKKGLVTIPIHRLSNDLTPGLQKSIFKQAQLEA